jgi:hypothetical protein
VQAQKIEFQTVQLLLLAVEWFCMPQQKAQEIEKYTA